MNTKYILARKESGPVWYNIYCAYECPFRTERNCQEYLTPNGYGTPLSQDGTINYHFSEEDLEKLKNGEPVDLYEENYWPSSLRLQICIEEHGV